MELKANHLSKNYRKFRAVDDFSYTFHEGVYGLLGVNGAGKTTLMRMLTTLLNPSSGSITWDGEDIFRMDEQYRKLLGYLPQDFGYYPDFSVNDYLMYIAILKGIKPTVAKHRVQEVLKQVGLQKARNKKMKTLSGGMLRRAGIAQAILNNPKILILDEPTAGLDPSERIRFRNVISDLAENRMVLLSTHIVSDVASIANEILLLKNGNLVASGTVSQLVESAQDKAWICVCNKAQANSLGKKYRVANVRNTPHGVELRVISKEVPMEGAVLTDTTLEDVFLSCMGERSGDNSYDSV